MSASRPAGNVRAMRRGMALAMTVIAMTLAACAATPSLSGSVAVSPTPTVGASSSAGAVSPTAAPTAAPVGWRRISPSGDVPPAREDHTLTVTPDGATAYLFGGRTADGKALDDFWALDLATDTWSQLHADGPPARFGHNAAWADGIGLVVFAGQSPAAFYNDLWAYDPAADDWTELPAGGAAPVARYGSCAAIGPDGRLWISHGFTSQGSRFADTRAYDFESGTWTDETPAAERPIKRCLHACWWTDDGKLALYGGQTDGVAALGDLWHLTPGSRPGTNAWSMVPAAGRWPADRQLYASARWGSVTVVFGGRRLDGGYLADAWLFGDDGLASRVRSDAPPPARAGGELITDEQRGRLLLFGGRDADRAYDDLWELTLLSR